MNTGPNKITGAMDLAPALFTDSNGHPVTCLVNVLYPWTTWAAVDAALAEGRN
jgi:hypothetical protein